MRVYAIDSETHLVRPGLLTPPLVCVSLAWKMSDGGTDYILHERESGLDVVEHLLTCDDANLVFHNAPFDLAVFCAARPSMTPLIFKALADGRIWDTKVREELKDIAEGRKQENGVTLVHRDGEWRKANYSLAGLAACYLGKDRFAQKEEADAWRKRYAELDGTPIEQWPDGAVDYALEDAVDTLDIFLAQGDAMPTEGVQNRAAWALHLMSAWGIRSDADMVPKLKAQLLKEQAAARRRLIRAGFLVKERLTPAKMDKLEFWEDVLRSKPLSQADLKRYIKGKYEAPEGHWVDVAEDGTHHRFWVEKTAFRWKKDSKRIQGYVERVYKRRGKVAPRTESGDISTDKDTMYQSGSRLCALSADGGGVDKLLQTYIPALEQGCITPINARFNVLVNSGRTSCAEPNLQNLPTGRRVGGVRECFVPREGFLFVSVDYNYLELCALAQTCLKLFGFSVMAEAINRGEDLHLSMAATILGTTYAEAARRYEAGDKQVKNARDCAKVANFGLPGGLGVQSLIDFARVGYKVTLDERAAAELKQQWLAAWPEMKKLFKYIGDKVELDRTTLVHPLTGFIRGGVGYTDGCNHLFQHAAAYGAKLALFRVAQECYVDESSPLFGSRPVVFVHDEIIAEVPVETAHEASYRLAEVMIEEMRKVCPDVTIRAKPALMTRWHKSAETVLDANGRLIPWEPEAPVAKAA